MSGLPDMVARRIEAHLNAIAAEFKPGAKLTLLVRNDVGEGRDGDAVFTNDTLPEAIAALQRRRTEDAS